MKQATSRLLRLCKFHDAVSYSRGLALQQALQQSIQDGSEVDTMLCLEHTRVFTIGKRGGVRDFRQDVQEVIKSGAEVHTVPRGGEVTYHGPGQVVVYPIMNVRSMGPRAYVDSLQHSMIATLADWGIQAHADRPKTAGVWVGDRKIGAVGVRFSRGVSTHGMALNVDMDLNWFGKIVPCGDPDAHVTSMADQLGHSMDVQQIRDQLTTRLIKQLKVKHVEDITPEQLEKECDLGG
eukprot:jgi/Ulvmu1/545/UM001_0553.1